MSSFGIHTGTLTTDTLKALREHRQAWAGDRGGTGEFALRPLSSLLQGPRGFDACHRPFHRPGAAPVLKTLSQVFGKDLEPILKELNEVLVQWVWLNHFPLDGVRPVLGTARRWSPKALRQLHTGISTKPKASDL